MLVRLSWPILRPPHGFTRTYFRGQTGCRQMKRGPRLPSLWLTRMEIFRLATRIPLKESTPSKKKKKCSVWAVKPCSSSSGSSAGLQAPQMGEWRRGTVLTIAIRRNSGQWRVAGGPFRIQPWLSRNVNNNNNKNNNSCAPRSVPGPLGDGEFDLSHYFL